MKQYKSLSLALLLSAPVFAMQTPVPANSGSTNPAEVHQTPGKSVEQLIYPTNLEKVGDLITAYSNEVSKKGSLYTQQLHHSNTHAIAIKHCLIDGTALLITWVKDPVNTKPSQVLAEYAKKIDFHLNSLETLKSEGKSGTGFANLQLYFSIMKTQHETLSSDVHLKKALTDITNPACNFVLTARRLNEILQ